MNLLKNGSVYLVSNITNASIPFLLLPFLTRVLTQEEYGQIAMFQTLVTLLTAFVGVNSNAAANRKYFDDATEDEIKHYNGDCLFVLITSSIFVFCALALLSSSITNILSIPTEWLFLALMSSVAIFVIQFRLGQYQIRGLAKGFGIIQVSQSALNVVLSFTFISFLSFGSLGRVWALVFSSILISILCIILLFKDGIVTFHKPKYIKSILRFGVPLIMHILGFFLINVFDRVLINKYMGVDFAGIYMVAVQLSLGLSIIFDGVNKAYSPWLFDKLKLNKHHQLKSIVKGTYLYISVWLVIGLLSFLVGPVVTKFIAGESYSKAGDIIGILCLGQVFSGLYLMISNFVIYAKKTMVLSSITVTIGLLNVILLVMLVPTLGLQGAAISFLISKFFQFLITWIAAAKIQPMPWFAVR